MPKVEYPCPQSTHNKEAFGHGTLAKNIKFYFQNNTNFVQIFCIPISIRLFSILFVVSMLNWYIKCIDVVHLFNFKYSFLMLQIQIQTVSESRFFLVNFFDLRVGIWDIRKEPAVCNTLHNSVGYEKGDERV